MLPPNTSLQKDAILALTKSATVFISYLASHANEQTSKKTIGPQDVLNAVREIEMAGVMGLGAVGSDGKLGGRLERELEKFEEGGRMKRRGYREKAKARESVGGTAAGEDSTINLDADDDEEDEGGERRSKKLRRVSDVKTNGDSKDVSSRPSSSRAGGPSTSNGHAKSIASPSAAQANDVDETESDPDIRPDEEDAELEDADDNVDEEDEEDPDEDDSEEDEDEEEEDENENENANETEEMLLDSDAETRNRSKKGGVLAPNGRIEVGGSSDEEDDDD